MFMGAAAVSAVAIEPTEIPNFQLQTISPDGKYAAGELYGTVTLYNIETGEATHFVSDYETVEYGLGMGNVLSSTGIMLGSNSQVGPAAYYQNGEWTALQVPYIDLQNSVHGITPDGMRICGNVGLAPISTDDTEVPMMVPAVWDLQPNGEYGPCQLLPHPDLDFTGRVPQYITAHIISDDGKTILGQIRDYMGFFCTLIWYTQDSEGEWSYHEAPSSLYNPNNLTFPEWPGQDPKCPQMEDFMTQAEKDAYESAYEAWEQVGIQTGNWDYDTIPEMEDYMSAEHKAAYQAAQEEYNTLYEIWYAKFEAFAQVYDECIENGYPLDFNCIAMSPDGKMAASACIKSGMDPMTWERYLKGGGISFNLEDNTYEILAEEAAQPTYIAADGTILATINNGLEPAKSVVYTPGAKKSVSLQQYLAGPAPETAAWIEDYMYHDIEGYDPETWDPMIMEHVECTGTPTSVPDLSIIGTQLPNNWDMNSEALVFGYLLPGLPSSGVRGTEAEGVSVKAIGNGVLLVEGTADLAVYTADGKKVFKANGATGAVNTGLGTGIYLVEADFGHALRMIKTTL